MTGKTHELKIVPPYFRDVQDGIKTFEYRKNDRDFEVRDTLILREWSPKTGDYTGAKVRRTITYLINGGQFGIPEGYCILGISAGPKTPSYLDVALNEGEGVYRP